MTYGIKIWTDISSVLSQFTCLTDGRTDRWTDNSHRKATSAFHADVALRWEFHITMCGELWICLVANFLGYVSAKY